MQTAYITHPDCLKHEMVEFHPECPQRITAIEDQLSAKGLMDFLSYYEAPAAEIPNWNVRTTKSMLKTYSIIHHWKGYAM